MGRWLLLLAGSVGTDALDKSENTDTAEQCHSLLCFGLSCNGNKGCIIAGSVYGRGVKKKTEISDIRCRSNHISIFHRERTTFSVLGPSC